MIITRETMPRAFYDAWDAQFRNAAIDIALERRMAKRRSPMLLSPAILATLKLGLPPKDGVWYGDTFRADLPGERREGATIIVKGPMTFTMRWAK